MSGAGTQGQYDGVIREAEARCEEAYRYMKQGNYDRAASKLYGVLAYVGDDWPTDHPLYNTSDTIKSAISSCEVWNHGIASRTRKFPDSAGEVVGLGLMLSVPLWFACFWLFGMLFGGDGTDWDNDSLGIQIWAGSAVAALLGGYLSAALYRALRR